jgi:hypothetical protein
MTPNAQREALAVLAEVWSMSPEVRLGQLLAHLGFLGEAYLGLGRGLGEIDDDELLAILYRHRSELEAWSGGTPDGIPQRAGGTTSVSGSPTLVESTAATELGRQ